MKPKFLTLCLALYLTLKMPVWSKIKSKTKRKILFQRYVSLGISTVS